MKKLIKIYLFTLLLSTGVITTSQTLKADVVGVCSLQLINNNAEAGTMCPAACTSTAAIRWDGKGKWDGKGTFNGIWTNAGIDPRTKKPIDMGACTSTSVCQCVVPTPPPPSCCDKCLTTFNTCISEGKSPPLTCSLNWQNCETACQKSNPGKQCTPPKEAILHSKK